MSLAEALPADHLIGANNPPEPTPFEAVKVHLEDLLTEARNWADGAEVENQAQADEISRLIDDLSAGMDAADAARVEEKRPLDVQIAEIQDRFNVYIAPLKNKAPGKVPLAIAALKATLKPFLDRLDAEKRARAVEAQRVADEAAAQAAAAARAAAPADLSAREDAEALLQQANAAQAAANRAANDKAQAKGGERALGLKTTWTPVMVDRKAALLHYIVARPDDFEVFLMSLAVEDVRSGRRQIPGFDVQQGTRL